MSHDDDLDLDVLLDTPDSLLTNFNDDRLPTYQQAIKEYAAMPGIEPDSVPFVAEAYVRGGSVFPNHHGLYVKVRPAEGLDLFWDIYNKLRRAAKH
jgi:hypothetical protein